MQLVLNSPAEHSPVVQKYSYLHFYIYGHACMQAFVSNSLSPCGLLPSWLLCPWDFPGKNTGAGCHFLLPGNLPNPGIEPMSPVSPELAGGFFTMAPPGKPIHTCTPACRLPFFPLRSLGRSITVRFMMERKVFFFFSFWKENNTGLVDFRGESFQRSVC